MVFAEKEAIAARICTTCDYFCNWELWEGRSGQRRICPFCASKKNTHVNFPLKKKLLLSVFFPGIVSVRF